MRDAVARFVPDGASICMGAALEALIPFAAGHELIRQGRRNLTLVGPISDMLFDQLVGAGSVGRIIAAWIGNVSAGLGHSFRLAVEQGIPHPLAVEDHPNLTIAVGLQAGALGPPTSSSARCSAPTCSAPTRHSARPLTRGRGIRWC